MATPMTIGEVSRQTGLRASAIRYYEKAGLIPKPVRAAGRRQYDGSVLEILAVLEHAKACGFTLEETRQLFQGFRNEPRLSDRWRTIARKKIEELKALTARIAVMLQLLERIQSCQCLDLHQCGRGILRSRQGHRC